MKKNKLFIGFILILLVLFITGCKSNKVDGIDVTEYKKGTEGLTIEFLEGSPPDQINAESWVGNDLRIDIALQNKGAYDIQGGLVYLQEFDKVFDYSLGENKLNIELKKKSDFLPEGEKEYRTFNVRLKEAEINQETTEANLFFQACYDYETRASPLVCLNPRVHSEKILKEVCEPNKEISLSSGQGAPVAITKVIQSITPLSRLDENGNEVFEANFKIYLENKQQGVVRKQVSGDCDTGTWDNTVEIEVSRTQGAGYEFLDCGVGKETKRTPLVMGPDNSKNFVICRTNVVKSEGSYETPLLINVYYNYLTNPMQKKIIIKKG